MLTPSNAGPALENRLRAAPAPRYLPHRAPMSWLFVKRHSQPFAEARDAFQRLHDRFIPRWYAYCKRTIQNLLLGTQLDDFVVRVAERLTRDLHRLRLPASASIVDLERLLLAFFHKQAGWTLGDLQREAAQCEIPPGFLEGMRNRAKWRGQPPTNEYLHNKNRLRELFSGLGAKDEDILVTSFSHLDSDGRKFLLPLDERDRLCHDWGFKDPNSLVQYRKRKIAELQHTLGVA